MRVDARSIVSLRRTPPRAAERLKPNEELLAEVDAALGAAGVSKETWQDSVPQPAQREGQSPYQRLTTRLYFEGITLQELTGFAHGLLSSDSTLFISALRLTAAGRSGSQPGPAAKWNTDLAVSYLV
jgi:hypothetical protein